MICGGCGKRMKIGRFRVGIHGFATLNSYNYTTVSWYDGDQLVCESDQSDTMGFYCPDCNVMMGVFVGGDQVGFPAELRQDLDDSIDVLPKKTCPECGTELDIDYPRCPECGYVF